MKEKIVKAFEIITVILCALLFAQFPLFVNEYQLRLGGHVEELAYQVSLMRDAAKQSSKDLEEYISKFVTSKDEDFERQGQIMFAMSKRLESLSNAYDSLRNSSALSRPFSYFLNADPQISKNALSHHRLGIPITFEGAIYAIMGCFFGLFVFRGFYRMIERGIDAWQKRERKQIGTQDKP